VNAAELVEAYLREKTPAWSASTVEKARRVLGDFLPFVQGGFVLAEHVVAYVLDVRSRRTKQGGRLAVPTVHGHLGAVRRFLEWTVLAGHALQDLSGLIVLKKHRLLPRTLSPEEVAALIEKGARTPRERAVLELLYGTGIRASELVRLSPDDVDLAERLLYVRQGKGRKDRMVPFGERVRAALLTYLRARERKPGPFFFTLRGDPMTRAALDGLVSQAGRRAGLTRPASPHRLRHSYATHLLQNGADVRHIQLLLGHASLCSTEVYLGVEASDLKRMIEKSHPRERLKDEERTSPDTPAAVSSTS
jgi:site-specific recombinase XerD